MASFLSKLFLLPCSKLYGAATYMRNKFFDWKILKEHTFDVPIITVGNLAAGGTGKTPHVEFIVEAFCNKRRVAVLSRGYRRATKGFIVAGRTSTPRDIGDEAYQIYHKFGGKVMMVVCEDRVAGINELLRIDPGIELIVLDDAFQHRYVKPTVSVLVSEYNRPIYADSLLPYGNLRESARGVNRADIVIVSKCPRNMKPYDFRQQINEYDLFPSQHLFFSHFSYQELRPVFPDVATTVPYLDWMGENDAILAIAGIGNPRPFVRQIKSHGARVKVDVFPDHHNYSRKDIEYIHSRYDSLRKGGQRIIVTTEKDAVRLAANPYFPYELKAHTFYLPVKVDFDYYDGCPDIIAVLEKAIAPPKMP
ncbi:MAG: tetraacyldisaccharide 4'-kinase [Muribaculaceae bacterium]|nr:tetraacyldisaccharide 4'-kinase [Muribaculaceae bacterium]